jgi:hypothetical protein
VSDNFRFMGEQEDPEMDTIINRGGTRIYDATEPPNRIPFTQFLRPDGRRMDVSVERPPEVYALAMGLVANGYRFEIEELRDGTVSMDCSRPEDDGPVAMELCRNGPEVPDAVDRLVRAAARAKTEETK